MECRWYQPSNAAEYVCREWFDEVLIVLPAGREIPQKILMPLPKWELPSM